MRIPTVFEQSVPADSKGYLRYLSGMLIRFWALLAKVVNNGIELYEVSSSGAVTAGNIKGYFFTGSLASGNTVITHNLGYIPQGFLVISVSAATSLYTVAATKTTITVGSTAAVATAKLLIV